MEFLIRLVQWHETFRKPEIDALADLAGIRVHWRRYSDNSPFAIVSLTGSQEPLVLAKALIERSILGFEIYELWGEGVDYASLHGDIRRRTEALWQEYRQPSFRFNFDSFQGTRTQSQQRDIIEGFVYMGFEGRIKMNKPDETFTIFEEYLSPTASSPTELFFGRLVGQSDRKAIGKYNLKKRAYISTTSMDAELTLVTANIAHAAPGKIAYDPFVGTGSFPIACAHFGSVVFGSDMDGRMIRGKKGRNVEANFRQYGTLPSYLGGFTADLTNTPLQRRRLLDAILCDPPYGVREGLKVLGSEKEHLQKEVLLANGLPAHLQNNYIPPKKPYSFSRMLDDILHFSTETLVDNGRLCMWMPVAGANVDDEDTENPPTDAETGEVEPQPQQEEYPVPEHPALEVLSVSVQHFNKWSRRMIAYRRRRDEDVDQELLIAYLAQRQLVAESDRKGHKEKADDLNAFRKKYFSGFK
ncbi:tRNA guanosine-2'-O-methyltransferase [Polychaeton citri CBS 116435]|uniref:tRNA (guanine(10)-N(2))-methyltransferase n=1 Tax=Polychaeton citri CBS 116435 TaxID=1314669 RepID=A0A9P4QAI9_9PEZI|nr:tRNA guanosine-2'-O-methyltransferase [Polychaeton citri CBS 116435]